MAEPQNVDPNFIREWWVQIAAAASFTYLAIKNHLSLHRLNKVMFDESGAVRVQTIMPCKDCRTECLEDRKQFREHYREDIIALHKKIDEMPATIVSLIKDLRM